MPENFVTFLWVLGAIASCAGTVAIAVMMVFRIGRILAVKELAHRYRMAELEAEHGVRLLAIRERAREVSSALVEGP